MVHQPFVTERIGRGQLMLTTAQQLLNPSFVGTWPILESRSGRLGGLTRR